MDSKQFFLNRYRQLGESVAAVALRKSLRVNTLKISHQRFLERMKKIGVKLERIPFAQDGYYADSEFSLGAINEYLQGFYYLQEAASQLPAMILAPQEKDVVLDMCAAPGGKTTQLAQIMQNKGVIVAVERKQHRLASLKNNIERLGVENCIVYRMNVLGLQKSALKFDKILLDVPCSGNYATDANWFQKRDIDGVKRNCQMQKELLSAAMNLLKKNGILVYSTCSLEPEENELNMQWLLKKFSVRFEDLNLSVGDEGLTNVFGQRLHPELRKCRRFWPHKTNTEGFFIAKVRKC